MSDDDSVIPENPEAEEDEKGVDAADDDTEELSA